MQQYMLAFQEGGNGEILEYLNERLVGAGFLIQKITKPQKIWIVELLSEALLTEASKLRLKKETINGQLVEFDISKKASFKKVGTEQFLLPLEKQQILGAMLDSLHVSFPAPVGDLYVCVFQVDKRFLSLVTKPGEDVARMDTSDALLFTCAKLGILDFKTPIHSSKAARNIWDVAKTRLFTPTEAIRNYFGEQVAYYCEWMNFYTVCLIVPGIGGAAMFAYNSVMGSSHADFHCYGALSDAGYTVEDSPYVPFFSFFMVLWSAAFLKLWRRRTSVLACDWDTLDTSRREVIRPAFKGRSRKSPVTGKDEIYYPKHLRFIKYCVSAIVSSILLVGALTIMTLSLNLQGYVHQENSFFYISFLSQYAQPGALFDPTGQVMRFIPVVLHVATIQLLNRGYRTIAQKLTDWENHRTKRSYESSLLLKRFCFEAFDCYVAIFYLGFVEQDILKVRLELTSLYMVDCVRRVGTELVLPIILQLFSKRKTRQAVEKLKHETGERLLHEQAITDAQLDAYEEFDDYLEMVIAFGYVTMFASAFPFAAFVQILYNLIEMKSDVYKLCFVAQRPPVVRANGIGSWQLVMQTQAWLALLTNVMIFGLSSEHMKNWCPSDSMSRMGCFCFGILLLEHLFGSVMFVILEVVPDIPDSVEIKVATQKYIKETEQEQLKTKD